MTTQANPLVGQPCPACRGRGVVWGLGLSGGWALCPRCTGKGTLPVALKRQPFDYALPNTDLNSPIVAGDTVAVDLQLDDDAPFEQMVWELIPNGFVDFTVQITDLSTGWRFFNSEIFAMNFARMAKVPFPLLVPYVWRPSSQIQAVFTATKNGASGQFQLVMRGYKLFAPDGSQLPVYESEAA